MRDGVGGARGWYGVRVEYKEAWRRMGGFLSPETESLIQRQVVVNAEGAECTIAAVYQTLVAHGIIEERKEKPAGGGQEGY